MRRGPFSTSRHDAGRRADGRPFAGRRTDVRSGDNTDRRTDHSARRPEKQTLFGRLRRHPTQFRLSRQPIISQILL